MAKMCEQICIVCSEPFKTEDQDMLYCPKCWDEIVSQMCDVKESENAENISRAQNDFEV